MNQIIEVTVSPSGETKIETRGFQGPGCQTATKDLESALGAKVSESLTGEFYEQASTNLSIEEGA